MMKHLAELAALSGKVLTVLSMLAAASYAVAGDRIVPASQDYVNMRFAQMRDLQIDLANGKREAAEARRDELELQYLRAQTDEERVKNKQLQRRQQELIDAYRDQVNAIRTGK